VAAGGGDAARQRSVQVAPGVAVAVQVGGRGLVDLAERQLDQAIDDGALVGEVEIDRGAADERAAGDRVDRDPLVGLVVQRGAGRVEDRELGVA
jgi:hypothetical protein